MGPGQPRGLAEPSPVPRRLWEGLDGCTLAHSTKSHQVALSTLPAAECWGAGAWALWGVPASRWDTRSLLSVEAKAVGATETRV